MTLCYTLWTIKCLFLSLNFFFLFFKQFNSALFSSLESNCFQFEGYEGSGGPRSVASIQTNCLSQRARRPPLHKGRLQIYVSWQQGLTQIFVLDEWESESGQIVSFRGDGISAKMLKLHGKTCVFGESDQNEQSLTLIGLKWNRQHFFRGKLHLDEPKDSSGNVLESSCWKLDQTNLAVHTVLRG